MNKFEREYCLEYFKCRDVKTPAKFGKAAGWDFFIPNDLTIFDFTNNTGIYINEFLDVPVINDIYVIPLEFSIKINNVNREYIILCIKNENGEFVPKIRRKPSELVISYLIKDDLSVAELETLMITPVTCVKILPGSKVLIPSGVHVKLPEQVFLVGENKSGIASKRGLIKAAQVIDNDYEGQIHINMINPTSIATYIKPGEKIIQFVPYFQPNMLEMKEYNSKDDLYANSKSVRGEGGFGSSGIK
jgi:dUTP pyrophosphatase